MFNSRKMCFPWINIINNAHRHKHSYRVCINSVFPHLQTPRKLTFLLGRKKSQIGETPYGTDSDTWTFDVTTQPSALTSCLTFHFPSFHFLSKGYGTPHLILYGHVINIKTNVAILAKHYTPPPLKKRKKYIIII